jgi:hypothetical protein
MALFQFALIAKVLRQYQTYRDYNGWVQPQQTQEDG